MKGEKQTHKDTHKNTHKMKCRNKKVKIIMVPYPAQGHVTPMLNLASAFARQGLEPVVVTPEFIHRRILPQINPNDNVSCVSIPDGLAEGTPRDFFAIEAAMEKNMPAHLERLLSMMMNEGGDIAFMVVDLLASWAISVGRRCGIQVAGFWPVMLATYRLIAAIPEMLRTGFISQNGNPQHNGCINLQHIEPKVCAEDLPWLIGSPAARNSRFKFWIRTMQRSANLRWLLANNSPEEQHDDNDHIRHQLSDIENQDSPFVITVGPLMRHFKNSATFWKEDMSCLDWLDKQNTGSVVYISFGSWVSPIGQTEMENLAMALQKSGRPFLWVLGPSWIEGLPFGYLERVRNQGKIVSWAPQIEVLKHKAVGCYLTHCGWNSTVEAVHCKKRLLCYPVAGDQFLNCGYIAGVWGIGLRVAGFGQEDIEHGLKMVMDQSDDMGLRLDKIHEKLMGKEAASRALDHLTTFVDDIIKFL